MKSSFVVIISVFLAHIVMAASSDRRGEQTEGASAVQSCPVAPGRTKATGYYPANNRMEGGYNDRRSNPLQTLQGYLKGKAPYVSVAMDSSVFKYGQKLRIPQMDCYFKQQLAAIGKTSIEFRVVDTGGAFRGKQQTRIDICTEDNQATHMDIVNSWLTLIPYE